MTARLITIPMSHYCEKARWALDHARVDYKEERHAPIFSRLSTRRAGAPGSVPALVTDEGTFGDSTEILRWIDRKTPLYQGDAAELEERFDEGIGRSARQLAFVHISADRPLARRIAFAGVPRWERALGTVFFSGAAGYMRRLYKIGPDTGTTSLAEVRAGFAEVSARLADGRRYLCGDRLGAADITFAALAAPVILPDSDRPRLPRVADVGPAMRAVVDELRATAAGGFVMRLYAEDRG